MKLDFTALFALTQAVADENNFDPAPGATMTNFELVPYVALPPESIIQLDLSDGDMLRIADMKQMMGEYLVAYGEVLRAKANRQQFHIVGDDDPHAI